MGLSFPAAAAGKYVDVPAGAWYEASVNTVTEKGYMSGVDGAHFAPDAHVTRATVVTVLWRMEGEPAGAEGQSFVDVSEDQWYSGAISWGKSAGIISGAGDGIFHPDADVTRQELAVMLTRYDQYKGAELAEGSLNLFYDAEKVSDWAVDGLRHAVGMGWIEGSGGNIVPDGTASRAQLAVILERMTIPAMG